GRPPRAPESAKARPLRVRSRPRSHDPPTLAASPLRCRRWGRNSRFEAALRRSSFRGVAPARATLAAQDASRNAPAMNFRRSVVDSKRAEVRENAGDDGFVRHALAAEDLHAAVGD